MVDFEKRTLDHIDTRQGELSTLLSNRIRFDSQNFIFSFNFDNKCGFPEKDEGHQSDVPVKCDSLLRHKKTLALFLIRYCVITHPLCSQSA